MTVPMVMISDPDLCRMCLDDCWFLLAVRFVGGKMRDWSFDLFRNKDVSSFFPPQAIFGFHTTTRCKKGRSQGGEVWVHVTQTKSITQKMFRYFIIKNIASYFKHNQK